MKYYCDLLSKYKNRFRGAQNVRTERDTDSLRRDVGGLFVVVEMEVEVGLGRGQRLGDYHRHRGAAKKRMGAA